jgi:hypothetical protein
MRDHRHIGRKDARPRRSLRLTALLLKTAGIAAAAFSLMHLLVFSFGAEKTRLLDVYKAGPIVIKPDPSFGASVDWGSTLYDDRLDFVVAPDGSIFVANAIEHNILKFDRAGNLVKKFGRKGQGPGDFINPDGPSILDGRFLVVGEYATNLRISLFNLDGTFQKLLKTKHPVTSVTALKDNKIAFCSWLSIPAGSTTRQMTYLVMIVDADSGTEREVTRWTRTSDSIRVGRMLISSGESTMGQFVIARSAQGNLFVGITTVPRIDEFSPDGRMLRSFNLNITPLPVTKKYVRDYKDRMVREMKSEADYKRNEGYRQVVDTLATTSIDHIFGETLPLYEEILVDAEGNILVFKKSECLENCPHVFQVYAPDGTFVCESELKSEGIDISIDYRFKRLSFTAEGVFCLFPLRGDELRTPHLIKADWTRTSGLSAIR